MSLLLLLISVVAVSSTEFTWLEGKTADPCNKYLIPGVTPDCPENSRLPDSAVTVLIPSASSVTNSYTPTGTTLYTYRFRMFAKGLPLGGNSTVTSQTLALGKDGSCKSSNILERTAIGMNSYVDNLGERLDWAILSSSDCRSSGTIGCAWNDDLWETLDHPLALCWSPASLSTSFDPSLFRWTGFMVGVTLNCDASTALCTSLTSSRTRWSALWPLTPLQLEQKVQRTYCCKSTTTNTLQTGQCINPNVQGCCGGTTYELATEKCCNPTNQWVTSIDAQCPCSSSTECPVAEQCCLPTKYPDLNSSVSLCPTINDGSRSCPIGRCYNPESHRCCDTGTVYDYGVDQCCTINGVQSLNIPCPCDSDSHCTNLSSEHRCCAQTGPSTYTENVQSCSIYQNWPTGTGSYQTQRCVGFCFDAKYSVCCNGVLCVKEFERCCNTTCCNRFTGTCIEGLRPGAKGAPNNPLNYEWTTGYNPTLYQQCSTIEAMNTVKAFWVWVFPTMLMLGALSSLALSLVFASKATPRSFSLLEYGMIFFAILATGLIQPLFFAPVYKYAIYVSMVEMVVILTAAARIRWLNVLCIIAQIVTLIYLFDPFHGNAFLNLSSNRYSHNDNPDIEDFDSDPHTSGVLHAVVKSWHTFSLVDQDNYCTQFYDWFKLDPMLRDLDRVDNPFITTFGYCSRGWVNALWFFSGVVMIITIVQLILDLLGLFFRFHHDKVDLEVQEELAY